MGRYGIFQACWCHLGSGESPQEIMIVAPFGQSIAVGLIRLATFASSYYLGPCLKVRSLMETANHCTMNSPHFCVDFRLSWQRGSFSELDAHLVDD
jgi:hypothetical protein